MNCKVFNVTQNSERSQENRAGTSSVLYEVPLLCFQPVQQLSPFQHIKHHACKAFR